MTDDSASAVKRDRSPKFPYVGLGKALERIQVLYDKVKRYDARVADIAGDWQLSAKSSSTDRTVAALQSFGLVEDSGSGDTRKIRLTELGARILMDVRPGVREKLLAEAAMKPPIILDYARRWSGGRPDEAHALSQLQFEGGFTSEGAKMFLRVFDETIRFVIGSSSDTSTDPTPPDNQESVDRPSETNSPPNKSSSAAPPQTIVTALAGERELTAGILSKETTFRLLVRGPAGVKEIERLIRKLELDKEILADQDTPFGDAAPNGGD